MKWLFYLVVLANAAFLSWNSFVQDKAMPVKEPAYAPPVSETIHLLSDPLTDEEIAAQKAQSQQMENALNQAIAGAAVTKDPNATFCPQIEMERSAEEAKVTKVLNTLGWKYSEKETMGKRPKFWLYIDAPKTKERANEIVKDLASKSIDSFIITREEMKNRISLGLYSTQEGAQLARDKIQKVSGYTVNIYAHMRTVPLHQVNIEKPIKEDDWNSFLSQFDLTKMMIKLEKNPC